MNWEYKSVRIENKQFFTSTLDLDALDIKLNSHARQGWELVSFDIKTTWIGTELAVIAVFKREG